jgi:hypothetical protein
MINGKVRAGAFNVTYFFATMSRVGDRPLRVYLIL